MNLSQISLPGENVQAFYFGENERALFGIYHIPPKGIARNHAILLCPSIEQEAIRAHRAYRQLAIRLSRIGFPVMRFDYWGTGDSQGEGAPRSLSQWEGNIATAIQELKNRSKITPVCLAGLRLGAALATIAAASNTVEGLALWEPVINGENYVETLMEWHRDKLRYFLGATPSTNINRQTTELLGMEVNQDFLEDIAKLDLLTIEQPSAKQMLIVEHQPQPEVAAFLSHIQQMRLDVQHQCVDEPRVWTDDPDKALVPGQILQTLVTWFSERFK